LSRSSGSTWLAELYATGVSPASFLPDASIGRIDDPDDLPAVTVELVEGTELTVHPVPPAPPPSTVFFLDGIQQWRVIGHDGVSPIAIAHVAAAARRRGSDRHARTTDVVERTLILAQLAGMPDDRRQALAASGYDVVALPEEAVGQPGVVLEAARREVHRARSTLEKTLAERVAGRLGDGEWLVVDGQLAVSPRLARHPRILGVIKSHGAQFLDGRHLERALTVPVAHRTGLFRVLGGHGRTAVESWYLRLWPWEGHDLFYGLLRIEARADPETAGRADAISGWLLAERAPLATPDARFDRLLYPIHQVEEYLKARAPRGLLRAHVSRLPKTGS